MSDELARAVGAGETVEVNGVVYRLSPITIKQLTELQRAAIKYARREYLMTFAENLDLLPEEVRIPTLKSKVDEAAKWDISDLPKKFAFDTRQVRITDRLYNAMLEEHPDLPRDDKRCRAVLAGIMDAGGLSPEAVKDLSGDAPRRVRIPYDTWWVTAVFEGMTEFIATALRRHHPSITAAQVAEWPLSSIYEVARLVESLTAPNLKNT